MGNLLVRGQTQDFSRYPAFGRRVARLWRALVGTVLLSAATAAYADNPGYDRPGIGFTPAVLGAGQVTWEQGLADWSRDRAGGVSSTQTSADSLLRMGLGGPFELQLGGSPYARVRSGSRLEEGHGDSSLGLKFAPAAHGPLSWGLLASVEFNDGAPAFRADQRQYLLGAQLNLQLDARDALGVYLEDVRAGGTDRATLALGESFALRPDLSVYAEAAWLQVPGRGDGSLAGAGLAWQATPRIQFDAGLDRRLGGAAPRWQANLGVSVYFGR
jgi:hypothetical protein